ncbi:MAG: hypothetical protein J6P98_01805 [Clostridia bacterium]|nr:hypothetical protein [Clostridia bacterium]
MLGLCGLGADRLRDRFRRLLRGRFRGLADELVRDLVYYILFDLVQ